jgi:hypothetical protein
MKRDCEQGLCLRRQFEFRLNEWGWFDAYERAVRTMPLGPHKVREFHREARDAKSALVQCRHAYVEHMAHCAVCSRKLIVPDAVSPHAVTGHRIPRRFPMASSLPEFVRRSHPRGTIDSICMRCFSIVATATWEAELDAAELSHECDLSRLALLKKPVESFHSVGASTQRVPATRSRAS